MSGSALPPGPGCSTSWSRTMQTIRNSQMVLTGRHYHGLRWVGMRYDGLRSSKTLTFSKRYFLPSHNPDGYRKSREDDRMWRKTTTKYDGDFCQGTDANRSNLIKLDDCLINYHVKLDDYLINYHVKLDDCLTGTGTSTGLRLEPLVTAAARLIMVPNLSPRWAPAVKKRCENSKIIQLCCPPPG